jgi:nitrogen-specific signal transduction histidine kinase/ActR/RegA family two-component response regulator
LSVILDISEYKELELRAQRAEKLEVLGTLAGGVAHDLNNVLGIIVGYTELLKYEVTATEIITEYLENIRNAGEKASTIVQDLLTLTRRSVYARKIVNMNKVIETCCKSPEFLKFKELHTATIKFELHPKLLNILGSPLHLEKSIMNLLTNAMESNSSEIIIETTNQYIDVPLIGYDEIKEGDYVIITIKDNGDGIKKEDLVRIFEPFYTSKIMGKSGTGLGLSIVWGSIKDHEGYINVTSEPHNTIFYLYLPVTRETELAEEIYTQVEYKGNGESILVIDDILAQRELATLMLRKLNYKVESVASGELAIEYLQRNNVDLIVLDMVMEPGMNGVDTFVEIKKINPKQKSIIVSGYSQTNEVLHIQSLGAGAYIKKPYRIEKIGTAIKYELTKAI